MTVQEQDAEQPIEAALSPETDTEELARRIGEALQPTFSEISDRVAEAVADTLAEAQYSRDRAATEESREDNYETQTSEPTDQGEEEGSVLDKARSTLTSSFVRSLRDEGGEQLEHLVDQGVDMLFSRRARGRVRDLADQALQAALYDTLSSVDDPSERYQMYRDNLSKLRPIVREAVDAIYNEDVQDTLRRELKHAIPSLLRGEVETTFSGLVDTLADVTGYAEDALSNNSQELVQVFQQTSTKLLEESVEDTAEEKIDPEEIQQKMQDKVEEARDQLAEKVGSLQEGVQGAQAQIKKHIGGSSGRGRQGAPPSGLPPFGFPPSGQPPSGLPPSGRPPFGGPPNGLPPAVERRRRASQAQGRQGARRSRT